MWLTGVKNDDLLCAHRKKQFNTGIQALAFSIDGAIMFSSAGEKEVSTSPLRIKGHDILSVEFGGFNNDRIAPDMTNDKDDESCGDLRVMGIDVRDYVLGDVDGYLVVLVLSDSAVKVRANTVRQ